MRFLLVKFVAIGMLCTSALASETVLLKSNGVTVTQQDIERYVKYRVPADRQSEYLTSPDRIKQAIQNIYILRELALQAKNLDEDQLQWQQSFQRDSWLAELAQEQAIDNALAKVDWEKAAKESYLAEPEKYKTAARVDAAHILIGVDERTVEEAKSIAMTVRKKALAGEDFNALAKQYSDDKSVENNSGELGEFTAERMVKPFSDAAFAMTSPGSISEPVETQFGVHIIKLNKILPAELRPFDRVKADLVKTVESNRRAAERQQLLMSVRGGDGATLNQDAIDAMAKQFKIESAK